MACKPLHAIFALEHPSTGSRNNGNQRTVLFSVSTRAKLREEAVVKVVLDVTTKIFPKTRSAPNQIHHLRFQ